MRKQIYIITEDKKLWQKIRLILKECDVYMTKEEKIPDFFDLCFLDSRKENRRIAGTVPIVSYKFELNKNEENVLLYPFTFESLKEFINFESKYKCEFIQLFEKDKFVILNNEKISLTSVETKLLKEILSGKGNFVSRDKILKNVWDDNTQDGVINVYIHYLREKLEKDGKKVIISSRKSGYKINERFLEKNADSD